MVYVRALSGLVLVILLNLLFGITNPVVFYGVGLIAGLFIAVGVAYPVGRRSL